MAAFQPGVYEFMSSRLKKRLVYRQENIKLLQDILKFCGEDPGNEDEEFEVVKDRNNPDLVHIKSLKNNKYWTRADPDNFWIVAGAGDQQTDQHSWSCTLFRPEKVPSTRKNVSKFRFRHVQLGHYVQPFFENSQPLLNAHQAEPTDNQILEVFSSDNIRTSE